jgi:alanyl-tRNA synthetase
MSAILSTITDEESRFHRTVEVGLSHLDDQIEQMKVTKEKILKGNIAFDLYATYGLPLEITKDILEEEGLWVDEEGFSQALEKHRFASGSGKDAETFAGDVELFKQILEDLIASSALKEGGVIHDIYGSSRQEGAVLAIVKDGEPVENASTGEEVQVILPQSQFYYEAGGQVSDKGHIRSVGTPSWEIEVFDTRQPIKGIITHVGIVNEGVPMLGDIASAEVDLVRKWDIMRNHTATHLLHAALQKILGEHARQAGSLVAPDRLRFDFTHSNALSELEIKQIEEFVNRAILENHNLMIKYKNTEEAMSEGAMALFGETYDDTVRTISIGDIERISYELCGGNHVPSTGVVGTFLIMSEGSVAAGAITGRAALERIYAQRNVIDRLSSNLNTAQDSLEDRITSLTNEKEALEREMSRMRQRLALAEFHSQDKEVISGVAVLTNIFTDLDMDGLLELTDVFRAENDSGVAVLASSRGDRPMIVAVLTQDLIERGLSAVDLVKVVAEKVGGSGGGKANLAQAGGTNVEGLPEALDQVSAWVEANIS